MNRCIIGLCLFATLATTCFSQETIELPVQADTYISCFPTGSRSHTIKNSEQGANAGASKKLKIKKNENYILLQFDLESLPADKIIQSAKLTIHLLDNKQLRFVGVSTLHAPWVEGKGTWDDDGKPDITHKGACFLGPRGIDSKWLEEQDSDFTDVIFGKSGGLYKSLLAENKGNGAMEINIPAEILELARINGNTIVLSDDTGIFTGEKDNHFIHSKDADKKLQPKLSLTFTPRSDKTKPIFTNKLSLEPGPFPGSLLIKLPDAKDEKGQILHYEVFVNNKALPWVKTPNPTRKIKSILLEGYKPSESLDIKVKVFNLDGNFTETQEKGKTSPEVAIELEGIPAQPTYEAKASAENENYSIKIVNGLTLFDPLTGKAFAHQERKNPESAQALYTAVQGETIGLQTLIELKNTKSLANISIQGTELKGDEGVISNENIETFREHYVLTEKQWIADILPSIAPNEKLAIPSQSDLKDQKCLGIYIDLYIPKDTKPGLYKGEIKVSTDQGDLNAFYVVLVKGVLLPDELSFIVEMNAYSHSGNKNVFHETYRMLHKHRLSYNSLGYGQVRVDNFCAPVLNSSKDESIKGKDLKIIDWTKYDEFYGPIFSGEIAKDLPRKGQPASHWYLPFHESWPVHLNKNKPELWIGRETPKKDQKKFEDWRNHLAENDVAAEDHFLEDWRQGATNVTTQLRDHFKEKGWNKTSFQVFCNAKYYFETGSSTLWTMDEPQFSRDYLALNFVYSFFRKHLEGAGLNLINRGDISRPQFVGSRMDESLDFMVVSSALNLYPKLMRDARILNLKSLWWYGGGASTEADPLHYTALFFDKWKRGCDGGMPHYTTFFGDNNWSKTHPLKVVPFDPITKMPVASFRMKAYRYGQQNMELLNILAKSKSWNIWHLRDVLDTQFPTKSTTKSLNPDDPGTSVFEGLSFAFYENFRERIIATILKK